MLPGQLATSPRLVYCCLSVYTTGPTSSNHCANAHYWLLDPLICIAWTQFIHLVYHMKVALTIWALPIIKMIYDSVGAYYMAEQNRWDFNGNWSCYIPKCSVERKIESEKIEWQFLSPARRGRGILVAPGFCQASGVMYSCGRKNSKTAGQFFLKF